MANKSPWTPGFEAKPLAVAFIDHELPNHVPALANLPVHFDPGSKQYIPDSQCLAPQALFKRPRSDVKDTKAMVFWHHIFGDAMQQFGSSTREPKGRAESVYSIRDKRDWNAIYSVLVSARDKYQETGGPLGALRKVRRKGADSIGQFAEAAKTASTLAPDGVYSTPILGAVEVVLDVVKTAAAVRDQALGGFDGLIAKFSDVELFLGTFPQDTTIRESSISLLVSALQATERAIGFFISNEILRGGKAFFQRKDYQKPLLDSLGAIDVQSKRLIEQAVKSHIHEVHMYSEETQKIYDELRTGQQGLLQGQEQLLQGQNAFFRLLSEHVANKEREIKIAQQKIESLQAENAELRTRSPLRLYSSPPASPSSVITEWAISPDMLRQMLDTNQDMDLSDLNFVYDKKNQLPTRERARAEQIVNTTYFRDWVTSPSSAKLMIYWDQCRHVANVSSLTVFCATMTKALRARSGQFLAVLWFCGRHHDRTDVQSEASLGPRAMLKSLIDQLLRQHTFDLHSLSRFVNVASLQSGNIDGLLWLLEFLRLQMPETLTLFFIIDGVVLFERPEFLDETSKILARLVRIAEDPRVKSPVKVLFASTPRTDVITFEEESSTLSVDSIPLAELVPSEERLVREING